MSLLWHMLRADVRRFRWALLLWVGLVAANLLLAWSRHALVNDFQRFMALELVTSLLRLALHVGMALVVALVVQGDPAVGTNAFWMTRPVPRMTLLGTKILLLFAAVVILPCLANLVLMLAVGVPPGQAILVALDGAISRSAWLSVLMAAAAITLTLGRFVALCGGIVLAFAVLVAVAMALVSPDPFGVVFSGAARPAVSAPEGPSPRDVLPLVAIAVGAFALCVVQYRTRLRRVSVPVGLGGAVCLVVLASAQLFGSLGPPHSLPAWAMIPATLHLTAGPFEVAREEAFARFTRSQTVMARSRIIVRSIEHGWVPRVQLEGASLTLDGGTTIPNYARGFQSTPSLTESAEEPSRTVARAVLGVDRVLMSVPPQSETTIVLLAHADQLEPRLPAHGRYRGDLSVHLARWDVAATLPLRAGARFEEPGYGIALLRTESLSRQQLAIRAREWRASSSFDRRAPVEYQYYLRNAQRTCALAGDRAIPLDAGAGSALSLFGVYVSARGGFAWGATVIQFSPAHGLQGDTSGWDEAWFKTAELVIVRTTQAGSVLRTLEAPDALLVAKP